MKLVIDIPDNYVDDFKLQVALVGEDLKESPSGYAKYVIANGTPLEEELEKIKAKIDNHKQETLEMIGNCGFYHGLDKAIEYIDKELSELKGENI